MAGVLFIVTIPTEQEEREQEFKANKSKFGHSSKEDISTKDSDKFEYGTFKIVRLWFILIQFSIILLSGHYSNFTKKEKKKKKCCRYSEFQVHCYAYRETLKTATSKSDIDCNSLKHSIEVIIIIGKKWFFSTFIWKTSTFKTFSYQRQQLTSHFFLNE